jgi:hypothetical protein
VVTPAPAALIVAEYALSPIDSVCTPGICFTALSKSVRDTGARVTAKVRRPSFEVNTHAVTFIEAVVPGTVVVCACCDVTVPMTVSTSLRASAHASDLTPVADGLVVAADVAVASEVAVGLGLLGLGVAVVAAGAHPARMMAVKMSAVMRVMAFSLSR